MSKSIFVTGGNSGIGYALCKQLVMDHGCRVFLGARSPERGQDAVKRITCAMADSSSNGQVEFVQLDTTSDESVASAAETVKTRAGGVPLYAVVNNAGTGLSHGIGSEQVLDTNMYGPKRVCDAFMDLLNPTEGRIVNVGSGAGPMYVSSCSDVETKKKLCDPMVEWDWIDQHAETALGSDADTMSGYGLSKALLACYTMVLARQHPNLVCSCITPGFIDTPMTKGYGATKSPEEGTVSILHCLLDKLDGNGWFYGSDALRSPLHFLRNPGEPEYDGKPPF